MSRMMGVSPGHGPGGGDARRRLGRLAVFAAVYTYLLVVFGGIVRITGSGLGCGDDWPRCNGQWIPTFTLETFIEYMHRLLAAGIGFVVLAVLVYAVRRRNEPGMRGRDGLLGPSALAAVLVVVQAMLGAITVWMELPTAVTVTHFVTAMLFLATLLTIAVRSGFFGKPAGAVSLVATGQVARVSLLTALAGLVVVGLGALTANTSGASAACMGFPLCNGQWLPQPGAMSVVVHWVHRIVAFGWLVVVFAAWRSVVGAGAGAPVRRAAATAVVLTLAQIGIAAALVLMRLPQVLQAVHLAMGAAIWFTLAVWTALARREDHSVAHTP